MIRPNRLWQAIILLTLLLTTGIWQRVAAQDTNKFPGTGNAGVNTTSPPNPFTIVRSGDSPYTSRPAYELLQLVDKTDNTPQVLFGSNYNGMFLRYTSTSSTSASQRLGIFTGSGTEAFAVNNDGNVGIGTTSPGGKLDVSGATYSLPATSGTSQAGLVARFKDSRTSGDVVLDIGNAANANATWLQSTDMRSLATNYSLLLNPNGGNVGIGTTSPGALLSVGYPWGSSHIAGFAGATGRIGVYSTTPSTPGFIDFTTNSQTGYVGLNGSATNGFFSSNGLVSALSVMSPGGKAVQIGEAGASPAVTVLAGSVGIGTNAPSSAYKLDVNGDIRVSGNINAKYQDVAEWVPSSEQLPAGTVVVLDSTKSNQVTSSTISYDTRVAGVVSEQPGISLGEKSDSKVLVATTGRVKVKVDASKGAIHIGDLLVTSDIPGVAMKSEPMEINGRKFHQPGTLIGKALEPLEKGKGTILVLLSLQ
jgi:hypothetical protein